MGRIVIHESKEPAQVEDRWICMCGLSKKKPFCDGSHKATRTEEEGILYRYLPGGSREEVHDAL